MIWRNDDGLEGGAAVECVIANVCDGIGDDDGPEGGADVECAISDGSDGIGDDDGLEGGAAVECAISDGSDGIGDDDMIFAVIHIFQHTVLNIKGHKSTPLL